MKDIVVIGGGGHAKVVIAVLKSVQKHLIRGYVALSDAGCILGVPFLGDNAVLEKLGAERTSPAAALGIGQLDCGDKRSSIVDLLERLGFEMPAILSPSAILREVEGVGQGTFVGDGALVNPGARVGKHCILNTRSVVEHDCVLGDFVHVAPGATLGGGVSVGERCLLGLGVNVIQGVTIAARTIVGAGATVIDDIIEPGIYVGCPARRLT
jgi:sugar O-acyltransferase (sialic acid O-acetyltransferase NeuD family)